MFFFFQKVGEWDGWDLLYSIYIYILFGDLEHDYFSIQLGIS